jgi:hypothetical protein
VQLPVAFDTGSAGVTLNALSIFPSTMVTPTGFIFPQGQTSMSFEGITVTNEQGTRSYGGSTGKTEIGNIGYATVTLGDGSASLTTTVMPLFLYYAVQVNDTDYQAAPQTQQGWLGVNDAPDLIDIPGSTEPLSGYAACSANSVGSCYVVSALKYVDFSPDLDAGFMLNPSPLQTCDILTPGSCAPTPMLTIGLTAPLKDGFSTIQLTCPPANYNGPTTIAQYAVCSQFISDPLIAVLLDENVLFDTGNPAVVLYRSSSSLPSPLPAGTSVLVTLPSGFSYRYTASATGIAETTISSNTSSGIGINYFITNSFFIDFSSSTEGWT